MGLLSTLKRYRDQRLYRQALDVMNPYVFLPLYDSAWFRWSLLVTMEANGVVPKQEGLPIRMTKEECLAANAGALPDYWGEVQYMWRTEAQRQAFYAKYPERVQFKQLGGEHPSTPTGSPAPDYPTPTQVEKTFRAWQLKGKAGIAEVLKKRN